MTAFPALSFISPVFSEAILCPQYRKSWGREVAQDAKKERNQNSFICMKCSQLASACAWKVSCWGEGWGREVLTRPSFISSRPKEFGTFLTVVPNPLNPVFCTSVVEFSLQITRGANDLCSHICPCLSTSAEPDFLQHTPLRSLSNNTFNTATSTCRNCPHTGTVGQGETFPSRECTAKPGEPQKGN